MSVLPEKILVLLTVLNGQEAPTPWCTTRTARCSCGRGVA